MKLLARYNVVSDARGLGRGMRLGVNSVQSPSLPRLDGSGG